MTKCRQNSYLQTILPRALSNATIEPTLPDVVPRFPWYRKLCLTIFGTLPARVDWMVGHTFSNCIAWQGFPAWSRGLILGFLNFKPPCELKTAAASLKWAARRARSSKGRLLSWCAPPWGTNKRAPPPPWRGWWCQVVCLCIPIRPWPHLACEETTSALCFANQCQMALGCCHAATSSTTVAQITINSQRITASSTHTQCNCAMLSEMRVLEIKCWNGY